MKFLHIIQLNEKNSYNLFKQLQGIPQEDEHIFFVCNYKSMLRAFPKFKEFPHFIYIEPNDNHLIKAWKFFKLLYQADHIILNSLIFNTNMFLLFFYVFSFFLKKATWIEWGADLYNWKQQGNTWKDKLLNHINYTIRRKVKYVGLTFEGDKEFYLKEFKKNKKFFFTPLVFGEGRIELLEKTRCEKSASETQINVQIAHNAYPFNRHKECIDAILHFSKEDINIHFPFSYGEYKINGVAGDNAYKKSIIEYTREIFGNEHVKVLSEMLAMDKYLEHLWKIDIAVFGSKRPIALANIYYLLYMGKKVYLPAESPHYDFFKKRNLNVYPIEEINKLTFEQFINNKDNKSDSTYVKDRLAFGKDIYCWIDFFNYVKKAG